MNNRFTLLWGLLLLWAMACKREMPPSFGEYEIAVRLAGEPDRLHPMLTTVGYATDLLRLTHFPLLEYHPYTLELEPVLAASLPEVRSITEGPFAGGQAFTYRIREGATWDDGTPVTGHDYVFTLKAAFHPLVRANAWRGYLSLIADVEVDEADPRRFTVYTRDDYFLALPATGNFNLYPRHIYDPGGLMEQVSLADMADPVRADSLVNALEPLIEFATVFTADRFSRDTAYVQGAGPYRLASWVSGEEIVLERKTKWWGDQYRSAEEDQFTALPGRLRFRIIPDEQAAFTALQGGELDLMAGITPALYERLSREQKDAQINLVLPVFGQYVFIALNNRNPLLEDADVRRALAHCMDVDQAIETVLSGLGERITGPFQPAKPYYNRDLAPIPFDPGAAIRLLSRAGWVDTNGNGVVDKVIQGKRRELELTLLTRPGSDIGANLALLFQKGAREAGIKITVENRDFKLIMEDVNRRNYDMALMSLRQSPADDDPYQTWHSDADRPDGSNKFSYFHPEADSLILVIRAEKDLTRRYDLYKKLHARLYEDQPVIFLYAPREPVIARKEVTGLKPAAMRPGYYPPFMGKD
jgi:peptide/nickel transport system substrate-binding protein